MHRLGRVENKVHTADPTVARETAGQGSDNTGVRFCLILINRYVLVCYDGFEQVISCNFSLVIYDSNI